MHQHKDSHNLSPEKGQLLVKLARHTISEHLSKQIPPEEIDSLHAALSDPCFDSSCGTFVTLTIDGLHYHEAADLLNKIRPQIDGVILRKGSASATFLPQVWEQLPQPQDFLTQLCLKAGLSADAWQQSMLEVSTYQVQHFEEHRKKH